MDWAMKRRLMYGIATTIFLLAVAMFAFQSILFPAPTCSDGKKNGFETGVDCGGTCSLRCTQDVIPLQVAWARALPLGDDRYDIVGLVENKNIDNAPHELAYTFTVYDTSGNPMTTYTGTTTVPVGDDKPIIIQNQSLDVIPGRVDLVLSPTSYYTAKENPDTPPIKTLRVRHEDGDIPRVYVTVYNTTEQTFANLPISIILYDDSKNAIASGESFINLLGPEEQKDVVFTWDHQFSSSIASTHVYYDLKPF